VQEATTRPLIISADDYGYRPAYDRGILEAASAGAVDAVGVMVRRGQVDAAALLATGVEVGLHLELVVPGGTRATEAQRSAAAAAIAEQLASFERAFGRPPTFLDGHHHCHAAPGLASVVAREAAGGAMTVRSVDPRHRRLLRCVGVPTPDLLVGRLSESEEALPGEVEALASGDETPGGVIEWMVHPGHPDPASASAYDAGRGEDLRLLLELLDAGPLRRLRATHAAALAT